jgi:hypothetical protein
MSIRLQGQVKEIALERGGTFGRDELTIAAR